jgi:predicted dehydrogenase
LAGSGVSETREADPKASQPLRLGILGCAEIARQFCRDVAGSPFVRVEAVASRDAVKAEDFARVFHIPRHWGSYEALLADTGLDAVYIPLPNSLHAPWAVRAMEVGRHVLCEKPLATGFDDALRMVEAARRHGVFLLEAYPYRFQPQTEALLSLLREGAVGEVRWMQACAGFTLRNPETNIRLQPELGGGALFDIGSYPLSLVRLVMGVAPERVTAESTGSSSGVDIATTATLHFPGGRRAQIACAMDVGYVRYATIAGSQGTIETEFLNHTGAGLGQPPFGYGPSALRVRRGLANTVPWDVLDSPRGSGFRFAAEAFAAMVRNRDRVAFEQAAQFSLDLARTMDALQRSAREGRSVAVL